MAPNTTIPGSEHAQRLNQLVALPGTISGPHYCKYSVDVKNALLDSGMELADNQTITQAIGAEILFADPLSPWQHDPNENTEGLICQYLPKKTNLAAYSQADLDQIADELNTRPRKSLGDRTPIELKQHSVASMN